MFACIRFKDEIYSHSNTMKNFFSVPAELNKVQKVIYTVWLLLAFFIAIMIVALFLAQDPDGASIFGTIIFFIVITFLRNKLFQIWK